MSDAGANWKLHNIVAHLPELPRGNMEQRGPAEFILEAFADPGTVKEVVKGEFPWEPAPGETASFRFHAWRPGDGRLTAGPSRMSPD